MRIYFAGSIRGGREDAVLYKQIITFLQNFGEVLTEHIGDPNLTDAGDDGPTDGFIHDRDLAWLQSCDLVVAEVTQVSLGVGYEIGRAVESGKDVLCLHRPGAGKILSAMITGCEQIELISYISLTDLISQLTELMSNKFNLEVLNTLQ